MLTTVKLGAGTQVHAADVTEIQKGRYMVNVYRPLCSSGQSTFAHNWRSPRVVALYLPLTEVDCKHCLEHMK